MNMETQLKVYLLQLAVEMIKHGHIVYDDNGDEITGLTPETVAIVYNDLKTKLDLPNY